ASEAVALAAAGPNYADTAAGLAATSEGETFAVEDDGIVTIYRHDSGPTATELRVLPTTAALASTDPDKGDAMVGSDDGASGTLWTTVKGFITYLRSSAGSTVLGFKLGAGAIVSAVQRTIAHKLSERV